MSTVSEPKLLSWYHTGPLVVPEVVPAPKLPGGSVRLMSHRNREILHNADPDCKHKWQLTKWSGYECNDCTGWYCA